VLLLIAGLVSGIGSYVIMSATHKDQYTSKASLYVLQKADNAGMTTTNISVSNSLIKDCIELLKADEALMKNVIDDANLFITTTQLKKMIKVENPESTHVVYISITTSSTEQSAVIANSMVKETCEYFEGLWDGQKVLKPLSAGEVPNKPSNPVSKIKVALIAFCAMFLVYGIYFIRFMTDDKINTAEDVQKYLNLSLLGVIPNRHDAIRRKKRYGYYENDKASAGK